MADNEYGMALRPQTSPTVRERQQQEAAAARARALALRPGAAGQMPARPAPVGLVAPRSVSPQPAGPAPTVAEMATLLRKASLINSASRAPILAELDHALLATSENSAYWQRVAVLGSEKFGKDFISKGMTLLPDSLKLKLQLALMGGEQELTHAAFINQLAFMSYSNAPDLSDVKGISVNAQGSTSRTAEAILKAAGYRALPTIHGLWGFQMRIFKPASAAQDKKTVVAFRGTEAIKFAPWEFAAVSGSADAQKKNESGLDTLTDLAAYATAYSQYEANEKAIIGPVLKSLGSNLIATGHSLGGGLAQIAVAKHAAQFSEVYTYQAANIKKSDVDRLAKLSPALKACQYRVGGDAVPASGEAALNGQVFEFNRVTGFKGKPLENWDAAGGHNSPVALEMLQEFGGAGLISKNNALAGTMLRGGSRDPKELSGGETRMTLANTYSTRKDTTPGKEGAKQSVTGNLHLPQMVNTYKNNAVYNILAERALPIIGTISTELKPNVLVRRLRDVANTIISVPLAHTASSELMLRVIFDKLEEEADVSQRAMLQLTRRTCHDLKFKEGIINENKERFLQNVIDLWYSLHLDAEAYLAAKKIWPKRRS